MATFTGTLGSNEIFAGLYNMIISQTVFAADLDVDDFVAQFRVDGGLFGDRKLYYSADVLGSKAWANDAEAANLLALHRPAAPDCQEIVIDQFRQIALTTDEYLSKRAWGSEGAFSQFQNVMLGMIGETKKVIDYTMLATFIGTEETDTGSQEQKMGKTNPTAQEIAQKIADILVDMKRPSREYNDYQNMRAYAPSKLKMIWNAKYVNQIKKVDLPSIFNAEMVDVVKGDVLPPEYFGEVKGSVTVAAADVTAKKYRLMVEKDISNKHYFPGDVAPAGNYAAGEVYEVKGDIICKIIGVGAVPFMSAFEVGTSFFNAKSLTTNNYLTFGYNTLEHLMDKPFVTLYARA